MWQPHRHTGMVPSRGANFALCLAFPSSRGIHASTDPAERTQAVCGGPHSPRRALWFLCLRTSKSMSFGPSEMESTCTRVGRAIGGGGLLGLEEGGWVIRGRGSTRRTAVFLRCDTRREG